MILMSCQQRPASLEVLDDPLIVGSPPAVLLDLERTVIPLEDYVPDPIRIDSVSVDGLFNYDIDNSNLLLLGRPKKPLHVMTLWTEGVGESILLKRTKRTLHSFFYKGKVNGVKIRGDFNDWDENKTILRRDGEVFTTYLLLNPGRYEYQFLVDGKEMLDPYSRISVRNDSGSRNSVINISGSDSTKFPVLEVKAVTESTLTLSSSKPISGAYAFWSNTLIPQEKVSIEAQEVRVEIPGNSLDAESSQVRVWVENEKGASNKVTVNLNYGKMVTSLGSN